MVGVATGFEAGAVTGFGSSFGFTTGGGLDGPELSESSLLDSFSLEEPLAYLTYFLGFVSSTFGGSN